MPAASDRLTAARREEIIDACARLYESVPFKKITLAMIGGQTSFTRTSIYNYFETKEEIFLALLGREYRAWTADLEELAAEKIAPGEFAPRFAALLEERKRMLKLLAMNLYDMESGSREERLVSFKREYGRALRAVADCIKAHCPRAGEEDAQQFIYAFFPFMFGIYPYTEITQKQLSAMREAGVEYRRHTVAELARSMTEKLTAHLL